MSIFTLEERRRIIPPWWLQRAQVAIEVIAQAHPLLDRAGWKCCLPRRRQVERCDLRSVATAIAFIESSGEVAHREDTKGCSYGLKHRAEEWGGRNGFESYVGTGDFILAALYCGVRLGKPEGTSCGVSLSWLGRDVNPPDQDGPRHQHRV